MVTRQPSFSAPTRFTTGTRTSSRNISANSVDPARVRSGLTVTPGASIGMASQEIPRCFGACGSVRTSSSHQSATSAWEVQIFEPVTTYASPSRTARVRKEARSEPAPGSLNPWHHTSSPRSTGGSQRARCSAVPSAAMVGPACSRPTKFAPT